MARALVNRLSILLDGEPMGSLDSVSEREGLSILRRLDEERATLVLLTPNPDVAAQAPRGLPGGGGP